MTTLVDEPMAGSPARGLAPGALQRVHSYLDEHLSDAVRLDDLALAAAVSRFHFARSFRGSVGESPIAYLRRLRIERAKQLLCSSTASISDIAVTVGFYDQSHFTRHFTRQVGTTPGRFARDQQARPCSEQPGRHDAPDRSAP